MSRDLLKPLDREQYILNMLASNAEALYAWKMVALSNGMLRQETIYVTLARMQRKGLLQSRRELPEKPSSRRCRRWYQLTAMGKRKLEGVRDRFGP